MAYKYKIYPLQKRKEKELSSVKVQYGDEIEHYMIRIQGDDILNETDEAFKKEVLSFLKGIDNQKPKTQIEKFIKEYKNNLDTYNTKIKNSNIKIKNKEESLSIINKEFKTNQSELNLILEEENVLNLSYIEIANILQQHLNNEVYMLPINKPDYADITISENDVYKKIITDCFSDFDTKVNSYYVKRSSEIKNFILVKDEKFETKGNKEITEISLLGFFLEKDKNDGNRIQYELAIGYKYKFNVAVYPSVSRET